MQTFGIYIIGDEILSGKREDKHLSNAIATLKARGLSLSWAEYIGDDPAHLVASFMRSFAQSDINGDIVFSFGGIGATPDDFTRQAAADALDVPIVRHPQAVAEIEAQFGETGDCNAYPVPIPSLGVPWRGSLVQNNAAGLKSPQLDSQG